MADDGRAQATVLVAGGANLAIAVAKVVVGALSGSSALLSEGAHSVADTLNQVFLLAAIKRSRKPADAQHPFGYGMERYFWSLLAAVGIFVLGAGFSVYEGIHTLLNPKAVESLPWAFGVLALSFVFEGVSWVKALHQLRGEARTERRTTVEHLVKTTDPTAKTVAFEDSAALVGLLIAAGGLGLHALTGSAVWDGAASILIGLLLVVVAGALGAQAKSNLIGVALSEDAQRAVRATIDASPGVDRVVELLTMRLGPDEVLVAARVDVIDDTTGGTLEHLSDDVEQRVRDAHPEVLHVFLDPTPSRA